MVARPATHHLGREPDRSRHPDLALASVTPPSGSHDVPRFLTVAETFRPGSSSPPPPGIRSPYGFQFPDDLGQQEVQFGPEINLGEGRDHLPRSNRGM